MKRSLLLIPLMSVAILAGCTTAGPETRPYSAEERFELSMEALNRQGLPFDQYVQARAKLVRGQNANATGLAQDAVPAAQAGRES
ncbi:hypothetical protein [Pseudomonas sp. Marseille-Q5115]|uniref:hypothetical protein n=1 Tax=Pseudomonas sp. Marseille-Q5115 TaxID=2866593 RepID=UPI001CE3ECDF|nr:hypothetical protein [Pseudomonas sp. Marseille-Q5115]